MEAYLWWKRGQKVNEGGVYDTDFSEAEFPNNNNKKNTGENY